MSQLVDCRTCHQPIARSAGTCPHCGRTRTRVTHAVAVALLIAALLALAVLIL